MLPVSLTEIWSFSNRQSMLDSQDFEERRITTRTQKLLDIIKVSHGGGGEGELYF